jgi:FkbM family methyltransferase
MKAPTLLQMITLRGHSFFPAPLGAHSIVIDLGAHRGEFSKQIKSRFGCRCIAVEANPKLIDFVRAVDGVEAYACAIAASDGEVTLHFSKNLEASSIKPHPLDANGQSVTIPSRSLRSLLSEAGVTRVHLLKVDIEGAEVSLLDSLTDKELARIDQITLEWHDFCGSVSSDDIRRLVARLDQIGFEGFRFGSDNMNWLFVRRGAPGIGMLRRKYVRHMVRPLRNILHFVRNRTGIGVGLSGE